MEEKTKFNGIPFKIPLKPSSFVVLALGLVLNLWGKMAVMHSGVVPCTDCDAMPFLFWADSIGTFFSAAVLGPIAGALIGLSSNLLEFSIDPTAVFYTLVNVAIGVLVGCLFPRKKFAIGSLVFVMAASVFVVLLLCVPLNILFYQGQPGTYMGASAYGALTEAGLPSVLCAVLAEAAVDVPDKVLSLLIATGLFAIYKKVVKE